MKKSFILIAILCLAVQAQAQQKVTLTIRQLLGKAPFAFGTAVKNNLGEDFNITRVNYYISSISLIHDGGKMTPVADKYIFVNGKANVNEELGSFAVTKVEGIKFSIGVEAPANNEDPAQWEIGHPLAPKSPSMHWGWSAGYRFVALEGKAGPSLATTYEMHGLGNANYFSQTIMGVGSVGTDGISVNLDANYLEAVYNIDVASGPIDHGVDATDLDMLKNFQARVFSPNIGSTAIAEVKGGTGLSVFPNPSNGTCHLSVNGGSVLTAVSIMDITGREVQHVTIRHNQSTEIQLDQKGIYFLHATDENNQSFYQKLIVR